MVALRRVRPWERGYQPSEVDAYLERAVAALGGDGPPARGFTPSDIRRAGFAFAWGGYDVGAVDRYLDGLELRAVTLQVAAEEQGPRRDSVAALRDLLTGAPGDRFARAAPVALGYDVDDVDALAERILASWAAGGVDPDDVRFTVFGRRRGGYDEDAVDDVLDAVIDVALREQVVRESAGPLRPHAPQAGAAQNWSASS